MSNSSSSKKIAIIIILAIIIIALWLIIKKSGSSPVNNDTQMQASVGQQASNHIATNTTPSNPDVSQIKNSGTSDAALNQDAASLDAQLNGFASDTSSASN